MTPSVPAVVVGAEVNGLGVIRALGRANVPVMALSSDPKQPTARSRYCTAVRCADERSPHIIQSLIDFGRRQPQPLPLFLTMERTVALVAEHRGELDPYYLINLPTPDVLARINDKLQLVEAAAALDIPTPEAIALRCASDLAAAADRLIFPVIVKPSVKTGNFESCFGGRGVIVDNPDDLRSRFRNYPWGDEHLIAQRFIDTPDSDIFFHLVYYSRDGRCLARFTGQKIRIWPPALGNTASAAPAADIAPISGAAERLLESAGFTGIGSVEFKRDASGDRYWLIEPTLGRTDYQSAIAPANGVNIPYVAYCDLVGDPMPAAIAASGPVKWIDPERDRRSADAAIAAGSLDWRAYKRSVAGPVVETIRAADDISPWLFSYRQRAVRKVKGAMCRVFDSLPWIYAPFEGVLPPDERWPPTEITSRLKRHRLPSASYVRYFTRDPKRVPPSRQRIIVSPADGVVRRVFESNHRLLVDISMSFYDVHVQRVPIGGTVRHIEDSGHTVEKGSAEEQGYFDDPWSYESDYLFPAQKATYIDTEIGEVIVRQITSIWAGRISTYLTPGQRVHTGDKLGHIFLGSTVVLELPPTVRVLVQEQIANRPRRRTDKPIRGGETIVAEY